MDMEISNNIRRALKNPKRALKVGRTLTDESLGKLFYGNLSGFKNNIKGKRKLTKSLNQAEVESNLQVQELWSKGFLKLGEPHKKSDLEAIRSKYNKMIESDEFSFVRTQYKGEAYTREILNASKNIPELASLLNNDIIDLIEQYYDSHFEVISVICWRNYHVPPKIVEETETISNRWHCDKQNTDYFSLFVLLSDVTEEDGPLHVQPIDRTKYLIKNGFGNRHNYNVSPELLNNPKYVTKATGPSGSSFLVHTEFCLHRAGIPSHGRFRDIIQFRFSPSKKPLQNDWINSIQMQNTEMMT